MVYSNLIFNFLSGASSEAKAIRTSKTVKFPPKKQDYPKNSLNSLSPTNWGTRSIMLPLVVGFKKILQESYANDIPK
jgi:hypothetical protein